ncbi:MAG: AAA family ATPase, partial [Planctomycetaceae bacterium]
MKIERIHIERYGAWQNLELPVDSDGISVYYGPNEAGKTTLMRFIHGILYGFHCDDVERTPGGAGSGSWGGSLQVAVDAQSWIIRRTGRAGTRGLVTVRRLEDSTTAEHAAVPGDLIGDIHETVYENIFAIGLCELQELSTLESREVAEHIYSLSLGLDGQQLLDLTEEVRATGSGILDIDQSSGQLAELYQALDGIDAEIENQGGQRRRHAQLHQARTKWEDTIVDLKQRQQGLENQLHGHEYLERVYDPWARLRDSEKELESLPHIPDFPEDGRQNLEDIETELAAVRGRRKALQNEARELKKQSTEAHVDPDFRRYAPALQSFVDQRDWIAEL